MSAFLTWRQRIGLDHTVGFSLLTPALQIIGAPLTLFLVATQLSANEQGYFFTFLSLVALRTWAEFGLAPLITNFAAHEWAKLSLDADGTIIGDQQSLGRLQALARFLVSWYSIGSLVFSLLLIAVGIGLFQGQGDDVNWAGPWYTLVGVYSLVLLLLPVQPFLEGCGQIAKIRKYRFFQTLGSHLGLWLVLLMDGGLWAASAFALGFILRDLYSVGIRFRVLLQSLFNTRLDSNFSWKRELLPLQWRVGFQGVIQYAATWMLVPVLFHFRGPIEAGQFGLIWQILMALQSLGWAWLSSKLPAIAASIAHDKTHSAFEQWRHTTLWSSLMITIATACILAAVAIGDILEIATIKRIPELVSSALILMMIFPIHLSQAESGYIRAHKHEPLLPLVLTTSAISLVGTILVAPEFGILGVAIVLVVSNLVATLWETWLLRRYIPSSLPIA